MHKKGEVTLSSTRAARPEGSCAAFQDLGALLQRGDRRLQAEHALQVDVVEVAVELAVVERGREGKHRLDETGGLASGAAPGA